MDAGMRPIDLKSLRLFVAVCESQSIAKAAELEHMEASAVSKRISQLELQFGMVLAVRQRSGIIPTVAGRLVLERSRALMSGVDHLQRDLQALRADPPATLRLLAPTSVMGQIFFQDVESFLSRPGLEQLQVSIEELPSRLVMKEIANDASVLGIVWQAPGMAAMDCAPYRRERFVIVVTHDHPLAERQRVRFAETLSYDHVGLAAGTTLHALLHSESARVGAGLNYRLNVSNFDIVCHAVAAGTGIGVVPDQVAAHHAAISSLARIELDEPWAERRFMVCCRSTESLSLEGRTLFAHLAERFGA
jgi:DNA-binding transcriptional LysR family regulator